MPSRQFLRYLVVGGLAPAAHLLTLVLAVERLGLGIAAGSGAGFLAALGLSYGLNRHWTFGTGRPGIGSLWRYALVCTLGLGVNTGLTLALVQWLHWGYLAAQLSVIFIVPVMNFLLSRHWAFDAVRLR